MNREFFYGLAAGVAIGGGIASLVVSQFLKKKTEAYIQDEVEQVKLDYARFYAGLEKPSLDEVFNETLAESMVDDTPAKRLAKALRKQSDTIIQEMQYGDARDDSSNWGPPDTLGDTPVPEEKNVFDEYPEEVVVTPEEINRELPYLITTEEYMGSDPNYEKMTLTYFEEDDTLVDEKDQSPIDIDDTVGAVMLTMFGKTKDTKEEIHVRSERLELDFEIKLDQRSYAEAIFGVKEAKPRPKRSSREDD